MSLNAFDILTSSDKFYINLGLDRVSKILSILGNPQDSLKIIHVAGTNGKGSVCAILNQILIENNLRVGLFTSPHLFSYTERIKVNNQEISKEDFNCEINFVVNLASQNDIHLTEFEILTVCAFNYFKKQSLDIVIMEVGLGGRLDATNVIKNPLVSIITTIDFDHTDRLGDTIEEIALEKAGIIKNPAPCVIGQDNLGFDIIKNKASNLIVANSVCNKKLSLYGEHQYKNLGLVMEAIKCLPIKISDEAIKRGIENVKWRFRLEYNKEKNILIDGAHNPSGIKALRDFLDKNFKNEKKVFVFGCLTTKDYKKMLDILLRDEDDFYYCEFEHNSSLKFNDLDLKYRKRAIKCSVSKLPVCDKSNLLIFCGSLYMLGEIFKQYHI